MGVAPEEVDFVMCTHLHIDHVGWNTKLENGRWVPTFPNAKYVFSQIDRDFDGSEYARTVIPRLKIEYQPTRALFFRVVSQYQAQRTSGLLTPTGDQIFLQDGSPVTSSDGGTLQTDWLVSYEPTPGTVAFFGYGDTRDTFEAEDSAKFSDLRRRRDGFFVKLAYQWRR